MHKQLNWPGSKWWKFDFHSHTPASHDYGKGPNQTVIRNISPKEWLLNYMRNEIDCIAITDHNSGEWIDRLKIAYEELSSEKNPSFRELYIFPGVEISVSGNIHVLAIFDISKKTSDIDTLLGAVHYRGEKGESSSCTEDSAIQVINEICKSGGIAIPAHVDKEKGLFKTLTGTSLGQILNNKNIFAMEVTDSKAEKPELYISRKINWSEILGSDSHHPDNRSGEQYPGSHFTWVKMSKPSYEGLKLALIDGNLSLRRSDNLINKNPNSYGNLIIENIAIKNAKYFGRGQNFLCKLSPWFNAIVGGRGTGKSTLLEFIRTTLKRKEEIPTSLKIEFEKYNKISKDRDDDGLLTNSTEIVITYCKDGGRFRISWNADGEYAIKQEEKDGQWIDVNGDITQRFPIRIYSQKQIFEISKQPHALMKIIDDVLDDKYKDWKSEWDKLVSKYLSLCARRRELSTSLPNVSVLNGNLDDINRKLRIFEKSEHSNILKNYQLRQNQSNAIVSWEEEWKDNSNKIKRIFSYIIPQKINLQYFDKNNIEDKELLCKIENINCFFKDIQSELTIISEKIENIKKSWINDKSNLKITAKINEATQDYNKLLEEMQSAGITNQSSYDYLIKQKIKIIEKISYRENKKKEIIKISEKIDNCFIAICNHRKKITEIRKDFLKKILDENPYVKINVIPYGNIVSIEEEFRKLINREDGGFERDIGSVGGSEGLLSIFNNKCLNNICLNIDELKNKLFNIYNGNINETDIKDKRFATYIKGLPFEQIDKIKLWFPEDSLNVEYSLKKGAGFKPVEQGSPGQRTAALLAFILSYGDEPLILDQPEDDLDNYLIYDLIVKQLREIKQKRQILIVTHNSNIVVNGDAENVIILDVRSGLTRIISHGSLQEASIRNEICRVMEGGKEAFDQRYKRINAE